MAQLFAMITPGEIRAARAFLDWSRQDLADRAKLSLNSIIRLEGGEVNARTDTVMAVRRTFEAAGIEFLSLSEGTEGVRVKARAKRATAKATQSA